jgi:hypothetical protein
MVENVPEKLLAILDLEAAEIMPVQVQQIKGEIGEPVRPALFDGILQVADIMSCTSPSPMAG